MMFSDLWAISHIICVTGVTVGKEIGTEKYLNI